MDQHLVSGQNEQSTLTAVLFLILLKQHMVREGEGKGGEATDHDMRGWEGRGGEQRRHS